MSAAKPRVGAMVDRIASPVYFRRRPVSILPVGERRRARVPAGDSEEKEEKEEEEVEGVGAEEGGREGRRAWERDVPGGRLRAV